MKKIIILSVVAAFVLFAGFASSSIFGDTLTTMPTTTTAAVTTADGETRIYVYSDYGDLVDQIYADVYDEIYAQVYADVAASVEQDLYDEIYASVLANLEDAIASGEISVVVDAFQDQIDDVAILSDASVIGVSNYLGSEGVALGSGVIYRYDAVADAYYVITNQHVVEGGDNYRIVFSDDSYVVGELLGVDETIDIAILRFSGEDAPYSLQVSALGDSSTVVRGDIVLACGHPRGYSFYGSLTLGVVSGVDRDVEGDGQVLYIQHDASINSGNSGGPLYNLQGEVIGINVSKFASTDIEGMGFAIPINTVKTVISSIDSGFLG
jgi:S1-C subfamily serine protease